jgi:hypothetical protein
VYHRASKSVKCYHISKGPGTVEKRIVELFAATRDRALSIADIADHGFELAERPASREQWLSATRAAHRLIRRMKETRQRHKRLIDDAHRETAAALGREQNYPDPEYEAIIDANPAYRRGKKLYAFVQQFGDWSTFIQVGREFRLAREEFWRATTKDDRLYFHPPDVPVSIWAISIQPAGVIWADAEITNITERNVVVRYAGDTARLDRRRLWKSWALWRGVIFVSSRTGRAAECFDAMWQARYGRTAGGMPPVMQMPLAEATALLKLSGDYTEEDVLAAFRREAKRVHPDVGGTAEQFRRLVEARDRLLAALGTSAPAPKPPTYAPSGMRMVYRRVRIDQARLAHIRRLTT